MISEENLFVIICAVVGLIIGSIAVETGLFLFFSIGMFFLLISLFTLASKVLVSRSITPETTGDKYKITMYYLGAFISTSMTFLFDSFVFYYGAQPHHVLIGNAILMFYILFSAAFMHNDRR